MFLVLSTANFACSIQVDLLINYRGLNFASCIAYTGVTVNLRNKSKGNEFLLELSASFEFILSGFELPELESTELCVYKLHHSS